MTTMKQLTDKLATEGGCIVASADCDIIELADARARGDFTVDDAGIGYVRRLPGWLRRHSRFARGATDSCEQRADEEAEPVAYAEFANNRCVRVCPRGYEERLPGTRMVPLYTHPAQAQPPAARVTDAMFPSHRACVPYENHPGKRIVGFVIDESHPWWGKCGLTEPLSALEAALAAQENPNA